MRVPSFFARPTTSCPRNASVLLALALAASALVARGAQAQADAKNPPSESEPRRVADAPAAAEPTLMPPAAERAGESVLSAEVAALRAEVAALQAAEVARQRRELEQQQAEAARASAEQVAAASSVAETDTTEERLRLYGFMDVGLQKLFIGKNSVANAVVESTASSFVLGNVNLYMDARPLPAWRALTEIRFTNYPHGQFTAGQPGTAFQRTSTRVQDTNNSSGGWSFVNWGSIVIERAQIEWSGIDWLNVRAGYWFTPYGIWNVDHGTPTLISLNVPLFVTFETFPARQLGVDVTGTFHLARWDLEYHVYVSNGRTPGQVDLTDDKMVGGRVVAHTSSPVELALGASTFYGRQSDTQVQIGSFVPPLTVNRNEVVAGSEWGIAGDVSIGVGPLRFRGEFVMGERRWDDGKHPLFFNLTLPSGRTWNTYGLLAYQLPWAGLEPYAYFEYSRDAIPGSQQVTLSSLGLNIHFTPATQLKLQYVHHQFSDVDDLGHDFTDTQIDMFYSRLVVAF